MTFMLVSDVKLTSVLQFSDRVLAQLLFVS